MHPTLSVLLAGLGILSSHLPVRAAGPPPAPAGFDAPLPLIEIDITRPVSLGRLGRLELDVIQVRPGSRAWVLGWPGTEAALGREGLTHRRISADFGRDLARGRVPGPRGGRPGLPGGTGTPAGAWNVPPFGQGSLAGFWTAAEVHALLDSLASTDSRDLVTTVDTIGTSVQGRPILALGVADLSRPLGTRPGVLFTSLHHAREPQGMQVVLHFLFQLLERYGSDPELTYLVREREIWFVPVVNPDGYVRNENTWFDTGSFGFWRKNLRNNDSNPNITDADGVDLNRNYGYQWGVDDDGSSPDITSPVYRGPAPFSEPETRAVRDFCIARGFRTANNYHAYWETCLYPWGYVAAGSPDLEACMRLADIMVEDAHYSYGYGDQILYLVNGEANDWMYGDQAAKPKVFAFTTEVGDQRDGFWPETSRILPLALQHFRANVALAYAAGVFLDADSLAVDAVNGVLRPGEIALAGLAVRHAGVSGTTAGGIVVTMTSDDPRLSVLGDQARFPDLGPGETARPDPGEGFLLRADPDLPNGTRVSLPLFLSDGNGYVGTDTVALRIGEPEVLFVDDASAGTGSWITEGKWGIGTVDGDPVFADSPSGTYQPGRDVSLTLVPPLDLRGSSAAVLRFRTLWDIETGYDFAVVEASLDSGATWTPLEGQMTRPGHGTDGPYAGGTQPAGVPGYDGNQRFWAVEEVDLGPYAGAGDLRIRFRMASDGGVQQDGWTLDDITVLGYPELVPAASPGPAVAAAPTLAVSPNPFRYRSRISFTLPEPAPYRISIFDVAGREVNRLSEGTAHAGKTSLAWNGLTSRGLPVSSGTYFVRLRTDRFSTSTKLLVLR